MGSELLQLRHLSAVRGPAHSGRQRNAAAVSGETAPARDHGQVGNSGAWSYEPWNFHGDFLGIYMDNLWEMMK